MPQPLDTRELNINRAWNIARLKVEYRLSEKQALELLDDIQDLLASQKQELIKRFVDEWIDIENGLFHVCYRIEKDGNPYLTVQKHITHQNCEYCSLRSKLQELKEST